MTVLFDFDGTLINSFDLVVEKSNCLAKKYGFKVLNQADSQLLKGLTSREIIRFLGISYHKIPSLILRMQALLSESILDCPAEPGIKEVLLELDDAGIQMGILTSNSVSNVSKWLYYNELRHVFSFIHNEVRFFSKSYLISKTLRKYGLNAPNVHYVCDETRDIEAAQKNRLKSIAVTWGYNTKEVLVKASPTAIIQSPKQLLPLLLANQ